MSENGVGKKKWRNVAAKTDRTENRKEMPAGEMRPRRQRRQYGDPFLAFHSTEVNRVSGTHRGIGKKRSNKVRIEFAVNVKGKR